MDYKVCSTGTYIVLIVTSLYCSLRKIEAKESPCRLAWEAQPATLFAQSGVITLAYWYPFLLTQPFMRSSDKFVGRSCGCCNATTYGPSVRPAPHTSPLPLASGVIT